MRLRYVYALTLVAMMFCHSQVAMATEYHIGAGDLLSITVFGEADLSLKEVRVATDGTVSFPLLGQQTISGLTTQEVEQKLTALLHDGYLKKPKVTVSILQYRLLYVTGQVKKPGAYNYVEGLTVEKAIALAGGFTVRGSEKKISMVRENKPGVAHKVDKNDAVNPGDIIRVGERFF